MSHVGVGFRSRASVNISTFAIHYKYDGCFPKFDHDLLCGYIYQSLTTHVLAMIDRGWLALIQVKAEQEETGNERGPPLWSAFI